MDSDRDWYSKNLLKKKTELQFLFRNDTGYSSKIFQEQLSKKKTLTFLAYYQSHK